MIVPTNTGVPSEHELMVFSSIAKQAVTSKMYKNIGDESGVMMIMLAARELNIPPMLALNGGLNIIQGKVEISARIMSALIRKAGHGISIKESTDAICTLSGKRSDNGDTATVSYTFAEAQKAGLIKPGGGWVKCPKDMLFARAISRLARQLYSDVIGIGYIEGEIRATEADITLPDDIPVEVEEDLTSKYLEVFYPEDRTDALVYLSEVKEHYKWSNNQAIKELMLDTRTMLQKFHNWANKRKK